jgi:hypothetical protein
LHAFEKGADLVHVRSPVQAAFALLLAQLLLHSLTGGDYEWDQAAFCQCCECDHTGKLADFTTENWDRKKPKKKAEQAPNLERLHRALMNSHDLFYKAQAGDSGDKEHDAAMDLSRISDFKSISESSDRRHHQYLCGHERDERAPEVSTQWVRHKINLFSSLLTPLSRSISKTPASLPMAV